MRRLVSSLLSAIWLTSAAAALPPVEEGVKAWKRGDYQEARAHWLSASQAGDAQAMYLYSQLLDHGQGGALDPEGALSWLRASAEGGYAPAQFNLGNHYQQGDGLSRDLKLAAHWWRQAALQGLALAQYNLGTLYYRGLGVPRDFQQARLWYEQAAAGGSKRAATMLARLEAEQAPGGPMPSSHDEPQVQRLAEAPTAVLPAVPPEAGVETTGHGSDVSHTLPAALQGLALGPDWLADQPPDHYTLQILATRRLDAVRKFLQQHRFSRQVAVFPFRRAEQKWYAVLYGRFDSQPEARAAMSGLPKELGQETPWVRRLGEFQPAHPQRP